MTHTHETDHEDETVEEKSTEQVESGEQTADTKETVEDAETAETIEEIENAVEKELADLRDKHVRLHAEFDNFRRRTLKEKADLIKSGGEKALIELLPVVDDFERAMQAMDSSDDVQALKDGLHLIYAKFQAYLKQNGVQEIETQHQDFDTDKHEAITKIPAPDKSLKGKVVDVIQKGYQLHDKVIRFAKVVIGE
ncbi:MAG: nucleotide exchange factor GrpE [Bacteroidales bacterium]|jgi:molecular chaperone GrpE|nr:nucleotide exchange factor GrpE [Bacteroidales bacterium]